MVDFRKWIHGRDYIAIPLIDANAEAPVKPKKTSREMLAMRKIPEYKVCKACGERKHKSEFPFAPGNKDGLNGKCKDCTNYEHRTIYARARRA